jgi:hypothetical protein
MPTSTYKDVMDLYSKISYDWMSPT